jgi:hypothetical protein
MVAVYKMGIKTACSNCQGILLLSIAHIVLSCSLVLSLTPYVDKVIVYC